MKGQTWERNIKMDRKYKEKEFSANLRKLGTGATSVLIGSFVVGHADSVRATGTAEEIDAPAELNEEVIEVIETADELTTESEEISRLHVVEGEIQEEDNNVSVSSGGGLVKTLIPNYYILKMFLSHQMNK